MLQLALQLLLRILCLGDTKSSQSIDGLHSRNILMPDDEVSYLISCKK